MGWLLRLFRSDFFDAFMAVTYLYRYRESRGVHDYLCNELYHLSDADLEAFMPQVCNLLVYHARDSPGLERFIMDKCADSMHMALQVFWFLQAAVEDAARAGNKTAEARVKLLRTRCETAAVNGSHHAMLAAAAKRLSSTLVATESPFSPRRREVSGITLFPSSSASQLSVKGLKLTAAVRKVHVDKEEREVGSDVHRPVKNGTQRKDECGDIDQDQISRNEASDADDPNDENCGEDTDDVKQLAATLKKASVAQEDEEAEGDEIVLAAAEQTTESDVPNEHSSEKIERRENGIDSIADFDPVALLTMKQERFDYFNDSISIANEFVRLSMTTKDLPQEQRQSHLSNGLNNINDILLRRMKGESGIPLIHDSPVPSAAEVAKLGLSAALRSVHLPLTRASSQALRILRVNSEEAVILTSRTRAPYLVNIEVLPTDMVCSDKLLFCEQRIVKPTKQVREAYSESNANPHHSSMGESNPATAHQTEQESQVSELNTPSSTKSEARRSLHVRRLSEMTPAERQKANVRKSIYGDAYCRQPDVFSEAEKLSDLADLSRTDSAEYKARQAVILGVYGELWSWKEERILSKSPFKDLQNTRLMPFIVKAGDDLRQEQLAIQLISQFYSIFQEENVDVFLRPFTVMSVSSEAGFVEVIPDSVSVHSLKKRTPNFVSLLDYFERAFGSIGTDSFRAAQRRFIRSMAAYSLVTYFLQIKDRHNGNIMIDVKGRIIHIDFGFMLTNSPGAIKFENVPFKLTEEYLQVICAKKNVLDLAESSKTEGYRYFQELFVMGLLAARKHYEKITTLVEIMTEGTTMPCMTGGHSIVEHLRSRFAVGMPEEQCINFALGLIEESRLSWRSASYDRFQAYSNGYR
ncbi:unnamed protein product [Chondrus crispus]|uniref:1-phosphatidylinositol 4-kinase n=1 Tax=Chondrus crispus TaxID=2769 RepID=R7QKP5_CHOCR|nr:unnamed protein product [Chondrus crispus]CDF38036.1 unnamed protein product [Chondrus crispus]|eukprot:XP_005717905.1 unnamed protein product [Chondrus crispus]